MSVMATQFEIDMVTNGMYVMGLALTFFAIGWEIFFKSPKPSMRRIATAVCIGLILCFSSFVYSLSRVISIRETSCKDDVYVEKERDHIKFDVPVTLSMSNISVTTGDGETLPFLYKNIDETQYVSGLCGGRSWTYTAHRLIIDDKNAARQKILVAWDTEFGRETRELVYPSRWFVLLMAIAPVVLALLGVAILSYLAESEKGCPTT